MALITLRIKQKHLHLKTYVDCMYMNHSTAVQSNARCQLVSCVCHTLLAVYIAEVAHVTRDSDTSFKDKGQGHQAALLIAVLARQAAATVGVGTCWPWETAGTLPSALRREALWHPRWRRGAEHIVAAARLLLIIIVILLLLMDNRCKNE